MSLVLGVSIVSGHHLGREGADRGRAAQLKYLFRVYIPQHAFDLVGCLVLGDVGRDPTAAALAGLRDRWRWRWRFRVGFFILYVKY
jgi:hypothetical protein